MKGGDMQDQGDNEQLPKVDVVPKDEKTGNLFENAARVKLSRGDPKEKSFNVDEVEPFTVEGGEEVQVEQGVVESSVDADVEMVEAKAGDEKTRMKEASEAYKKALDEAQELAAEIGADLHDEKYKETMMLGYADFVEKFPKEARKIAEQEADEYLQELVEKREFEEKMDSLEGLQDLLDSGKISDDEYIEGFAKVLGEDSEKAKEACKKFLEENESASIQEAMEKLKNGELPIPESIEDEDLRNEIEEQLGEEEEEEEEVSAEIDMEKVREKAKWVYETARATQRNRQGASGLRMEIARQIAGKDGNIVEAGKMIDGKLKDLGMNNWADLNLELYYRNYKGLVKMVQENAVEGEKIAKEVKKKFKQLMIKRLGAYMAIEGIFYIKDTIKTFRDMFLRSMLEEAQRA